MINKESVQLRSDGPHFNVEIRNPADIPAQLRHEFMLLVRKGGEVRKDTLNALVTNALALGVVRIEGVLAGVGGIKRPNPGYRAQVFSRAGLTEPERFPYELGWVFVDEPYRRMGISTALVSELAQRLGDTSAYATSRVHNERMHRVLAKVGFQAAGAPYSSKRKGEVLQLFLREATASIHQVGAS